MCAAKSKEREVDHIFGQQDLDDLDRDLLQDPDWYQKELENIKKAELRQDWELKRRLLVRQIEQIEQDIVKSQASLVRSLDRLKVVKDNSVRIEIEESIRRMKQKMYNEQTKVLQLREELHMIGRMISMVDANRGFSFGTKTKTKTKKSKAKKSKSRTKKSKTKKSNLKKSKSKNKNKIK